MQVDVKRGQVYRHHSGRVYTVLDVANAAHPSPKFPLIVVYVGANGETWARPLSQFVEKFSLLYSGSTLAPVPIAETIPPPAVLINRKALIAVGSRLTYEGIVAAAGCDPASNPTVTYRRAGSVSYHDGILFPGETLVVNNRTIITCVDTGNSPEGMLISIVINGRKHKLTYVPGPIPEQVLISYEQIAGMAGYSPNMFPTVTYQGAKEGKGEGTLLPGQYLTVDCETIINCVDTSNA